MDIQLSSNAFDTPSCIIAFTYSGGEQSAVAEELDRQTDGYLSQLVARGDLSAKIGECTLLLHLPKARVERALLIGLGSRPEVDRRAFVRCCRLALEKLEKMRIKEVALALFDEDTAACCPLLWSVQTVARLAVEASYRFDDYKKKKASSQGLAGKKLRLVVPHEHLAKATIAVARGREVGLGANFARDLGNTPPNVCTPVYLEKQAKDLAKKKGKDGSALRVQSLGEFELTKLGMEALLAVAHGSTHPPRLISLEHSGGKEGEAPVVLVGKGVTFDTGGISLKPSKDMDEMKYDMCGAASVFGVICACQALALPLNVVGVIPAVENMPGGKATRPGDIVKTAAGDSVEILNTDAEGRLILCDALHWSQQFKPRVLIDIATLTGACVVALGRHRAGLFSNDEGLAGQLHQAGEDSGDLCWRLPLGKEYNEELKSNFADVANIAGAREAGAVTAACFLERFVGETPWAHLDIAGVAWLSGHHKGATGRPVPLLMEYLFRCVDPS